ncbi:MAG: peptide deformylase [bacterium]|nr:peptide deformylase [bacterium]
MAVRPVVKLPHNVLRNPAEAVPIAEISGARIQRLIRDMKDTLAASTDGVGLAAPQIGAGVRLFLVSEEAKAIGADAQEPQGMRGLKAWQYFVFINPVLGKRSRQKTTAAEGCLSVPGKFGEVTRSDKVYLEWLDEHAMRHRRGFAGFFARVIQHELDHLDGVLIVERAKKLFHVTGGKS